MKILVINCGSSSLKYQLIDGQSEAVLAKGLAERIGLDKAILNHTPAGGDKQKFQIDMPDHKAAVQAVLNALVSQEHGVIADMSEIKAIGHRVVHGGEKFATSVLITDEVKKAIEECTSLAPLHNPPNMIGIEACEHAMPGVPQVGVFDTAFHQTMPEEAYMYAIPYELYQKHAIRKYGFHGTSHKFVAEEVAKLIGKPLKELKVITCHLGNGSSLAAIKNGECIDTTMGLTPLAGIAMGTRSGDIDPAIVTFLQKVEGLTASDVDALLNKKSGMQGISGTSSDFRDLWNNADAGDKRAKLALAMFIYQGKKFIGSYAAAMGGLDAIVFTAGVGENDDLVRAGFCTGLEFLGVKFNYELNKGLRGTETLISTPDSKVQVWIVPTNEELAIAKETVKVLEL